VAPDRLIETDLRLVQAEQVLAELETLLHGPAQPGGGDQARQGDGLAGASAAVRSSVFRRTRVASAMRAAAALDLVLVTQT